MHERKRVRKRAHSSVCVHWNLTQLTQLVVQCSVVVYHECVWHAHLLNRVNFGSVRESIMRVCIHTCNNGMFEQYRVCQLS